MSNVELIVQGEFTSLDTSPTSMVMNLLPSSTDMPFDVDCDLVPTVYVTNIRAISSTRIRIDFSGSLDKTTELENTGNYLLTGSGVPLTLFSVYVPDISSPTSIDLIVSEMTDAASYALTIGEAVTSGGYPVQCEAEGFTGVGDKPEVEVVIATSSTTMEIRFTEAIRNTDLVRDTDNFVFTEPLTVEEVLSVEGSVITLRTGEQTEATLYELTIDGTFNDYAMNALEVPVVTNMLGYREPTTEEEALQLSMYNFLGQNLRDEDQVNGGQFLERFFEGPQEVWKSTNDGILSLPNLHSPVLIADALVPYLAQIVGWSGDLATLFARLPVATQRRVVESSVAFWKARGTEDSIEDIIRLMTGARAEVWTYFDYRWITDETHLGIERDGYDPWTISHDPFTYEAVTVGAREFFSGDGETAQSESISMGEMDVLFVFIVTKGGRPATMWQPSCVETMKFNDLDMNHLGYVESFYQGTDSQLRTDVYWVRHVAGITGDLEWQVAKHPSVSYSSWQVYAVRVESFRTASITSGRINYSPSGTEQFCDAVESGENDVILSLCSSKQGEFGIAPVSPSVQLEFEEDGFTTCLARTEGTGGLTEVKYLLNAGSGDHIVELISVNLNGYFDGLGTGGEQEYQIRVVDDGDLDRELIRSLARLTRPTGERVWIFYLAFLDRFTTDDDLSQWTEENDGTNATVANGMLTLPGGTGNETSVYVSVDEADVWDQYVATWRVKGNDEFELLFYRSTEDDQYFVRVTTADFGGDNGTIELYSNVAGTPSLIQSVSLGTGFDFENDVYHTIRIEVSRDGTENEIRVLLDAVLLMSEVDSDHSSGTIGVRNHVTAPKQVDVDEVEVFFLPAETDFIDINTRE